MTANYLIIGQGDIGLPVTNQLAASGYQVTGLARSDRSHYDISPSANFIQADALTLTSECINEFTHIAIIVSPDSYTASYYEQTYFGIANHLATMSTELPNVSRMVFISSTGVYGQDEGEWIDATIAPMTPKREASQYILQAEQVLQTAFDERAIIIRPSGIYGTKRLMRIRKAQENNKSPISANAWTNRVMDTDLVTIICKVLTESDQTQLAPIYLATDYCPVTSFELTYWLCKRLKSELPSVKTDDPNAVTGKRLHSNIPRDWLHYPDWQNGYEYILHTI